MTPEPPDVLIEFTEDEDPARARRLAWLLFGRLRWETPVVTTVTADDLELELERALFRIEELERLVDDIGRAAAPTPFRTYVSPAGSAISSEHQVNGR